MLALWKERLEWCKEEQMYRSQKIERNRKLAHKNIEQIESLKRATSIAVRKEYDDMRKEYYDDTRTELILMKYDAIRTKLILVEELDQSELDFSYVMEKPAVEAIAFHEEEIENMKKLETARTARQKIEQGERERFAYLSIQLKQMTRNLAAAEFALAENKNKAVTQRREIRKPMNHRRTKERKNTKRKIKREPWTITTRRELAAAEFALAENKNKIVTQRKEVRKPMSHRRINERKNTKRKIKREPRTMQLDGLVESDEEPDGDDAVVGREIADGNNDSNVEVKVPAIDDTDGEKKQTATCLEAKGTTTTTTIDEQCVASNRHASTIGETTIYDDDDNGKHAIAVLLTEHKDDEDDGGHTATVLVKDITDEANEFKENRTREQIEKTENAKDKVLSADDTDGKEEREEHFECIMEQQRIAGDRYTSTIGATIVEDGDDDSTHAITVVLVDNKNDEDESQENDDDDGGQAAAVLFTDNTNDEDALKENRTREQTEDRNITSHEKTENHPCFRYPTRKVEYEEEQDLVAQLALWNEQREVCRKHQLCYKKHGIECMHIVHEIEKQLAIIESNESSRQRDDDIDNIRREYEKQLKVSDGRSGEGSHRQRS